MEWDLPGPRFTVGQEIATSLVSCGLFTKVWEESHRASNAESFTLNEYEDVAYVTFPSFRGIEDFICVNGSQCGEGNMQMTRNSFLSCLKGNDGEPAFIHAGALNLFLHIMEKTDFQAKLQIYTGSKQRKLKPIVFVGHSLGGAVATLATLWVLGKRLRQISPFCITFGCPLVGDERLVEAVGRENWGGNFCHVVSKHDIVPRMLLAPFESVVNPFTTVFPFWQGISVPGSLNQNDSVIQAGRTLLHHVLDPPSNPYRPFGTYMFCSSNGAACIENSQTVLEMLRLTMNGQETSSDEIVQACLLEHTMYGSILGEVMQNFIKGIRLLNSEISEYSYDMGLALQLEAIGVGAQNDDAQRALRRAGEIEHEYNINVDMLAVELSKKQSAMAELEWYKEDCEKDRRAGYYDSFPNHEKKDNKANLHRKGLANYWDGIIEMWRRHELPSNFQFQNKWINAGNAYRRLVEPLDIADHYHPPNANSNYSHTPNYLSGGRPDRYKVLQKWLEEKDKIRSARGPQRRTKRASLTQDSCFWAHVEEARKDLEGLKLKQGQHQRLQNLENFEQYVITMENDLAISSDVFFKESSFMMWWKEWEEYMKSQSHEWSSPLSEIITKSLEELNLNL